MSEPGPYAGKGPRGWTPGDMRLREAVSERMLEDPLLDARGIEVAADDGAIVLTGEVPGPSDVDHAEMLARGTAGVTAVSNLLRVRPGPRAVDRLAAAEAAPDHHWSPSIPPDLNPPDTPLKR